MQNSMQDFKENMKNPKFRSAVYLCGYFLLGFIIILLARSRTNVPPKVENTHENPPVEEINEKSLLFAMQNYAYTITIKTESEEYKISGMRNKEEELFSYPIGVSAYYLKNGQYYLSDKDKITKVDNPFPLELRKLKPENIAVMLTGLQSSKEKIGQSTQITYQIPISIFSLNYAYPSMQDDVLPLTMQIQDNKIETLQLDLTNYVESKMTVLYEFSDHNLVKEWQIDVEDVE